MRAMTATMLLLAGLGTGCLSEKGRNVTGDTEVTDTSGDTSGDTGSDSTADTRADVPDTDLCANVACDDGDPCTFDRCDPATGQCEFLGVPGDVPASGCVSDAECEDGDPCTANACVGLGCGAGSYCVSDPIPGCNDCAAGCSDNDPCTSDSCRDGQCLHDFAEGCMAECVAGTTYSIPEIRSQFQVFADPIKTTGELYFSDLGRSCDDGPTCDCVGHPGLRDGGFDLVLTDSANSTGSSNTWQCRSTGCIDVTPTCQPAKVRVAYRVWGRGLFDYELFAAGTPGDAAVPARAIAGIAVQDYCLETKDRSLVGEYDGMIQVAGYTFEFKAQISDGDNGKLRLRYDNGSCNGCPGNLFLDDLDAPLTVGDGWVEFDATLPSLTGQAVETVRLYSNRSTLQGSYGQTDGVVPFIALPPGGTMVLTRL